MTKEVKSVVELAEQYLKLDESEKMYIVGVMQGIMLQQKNKPKPKSA